MGLPTTLPAYQLGEETIRKIVARFEKQATKIGEKSDIDYQQIETILTDRL